MRSKIGETKWLRACDGDFHLTLGVDGNPSLLKATTHSGQKLDNVEMSCEEPAPVVAGGPVIHQYGCAISDHRVGVSYSLEVATAAVSPEHSVRSIAVLQTPEAPRPEHHRFEMDQVLQTAHQAIFAHESLRVALDKQSWKLSSLLTECNATCTAPK